MAAKKKASKKNLKNKAVKKIAKKKPIKKTTKSPKAVAKKKAVKKAVVKKKVDPKRKAATVAKPGSAVPPKVKGKEIIKNRGRKRGLTQGIDIDITFKMGIGEITATLFRNTITIDEKKVTQTGSINFDEVLAGDVISVNGACAGTGELVTNRTTDPVSDQSSPRKYTAGGIFDNLDIL